MGKILVALATTRYTETLGTRAIAEARERGSDLDLLLVTEKDEIDRVYQFRADPFLIGNGPLTEILKGIEQEHVKMLDERAAEIERLARDAGIAVTRQSVEASYDQAVFQAAARGGYDVVYWLRHNRSFIARFFLGEDQHEVVRVETRGGKTQ